MLDKLSFTPVNGGDDGRGLTLIGSKTCDFFHEAKELLNELNAGYSWAVLDPLELEDMQAVVGYLKEKYTHDVVCPFLFYGENKYLSGFNREIWIEKLK